MRWSILTLALLCALPGPTMGSADSNSNSCGPSSRYVVAYYQTWKRQSLMNIDWAKITHLNVAHAIPTDSGDFTFDGEWFLPQLVRDAHKAQTKVSVSIGGWTGSNRLSTIMHDPHKRAQMIRSINAFIDKYELDGIDIDWEFVGRQGSKCNKLNREEDSGNFLRFLRTLRASLHARFPNAEKLISLAVHTEPFGNADGALKDTSMFAEFVDFASITAFDVNGPWSNTTGPNAPLTHEKNRGAQYSLKQSVDQWLESKWPADKLVAGVAFHGRSLTTKKVLTAKEGTSQYALFDKDVPQGDPEDAYWFDVCENVNSMSGVWQYKHLRDQGVLKTANTTGEEWIRVWDNTTVTPWLYNPEMRRFISYDDPESVAQKVEFATKMKLKGMMAWSLHADYNNELLGELAKIGPLCRGPVSSDQTVQSTSSVESSTSTWSPSPPFISLPTLSTSRSSETSSTSSGSSTTERSTTTTEASATTSEPPVSTSSTTASPTLSSESADQSASPSKAILFDSQGAPYMIIDGHSTPVPSELADKLMQIGVHTPTVTSSALPSEPLAIPVVETTDVTSSKTQSKSTSTDLFSLGKPSAVPTSEQTGGFAATFFLTLDTTTGISTVIPFSQMMADALTKKKQSTSESIDTLRTDSLVSMESASDPLATSSSKTTPLF
ncbi:glycosyl hydrolases family 18-domain-containing protein [Coemansia spiralis]|nr:glycosyl hydrolases family 18-domain-containing protein [Coemansia spiralis]